MTLRSLAELVAQLLNGFRQKVASSRHPAAFPDESLSASDAQAGDGFVDSVRALVDFAQKRGDSQLAGQLRWLHSTLQRWLISSALTGPQLRADLDEMVKEVVVTFAKMVALGVDRRDLELLAHLGRLQAAWVRWAESSAADPVEAGVR